MQVKIVEQFKSGPDICTSIREIAETLKAKIDESIIINYDISKPTGDKGRCANYSKAKKLLSWEPTINIEDGLEDLLGLIKSKRKKCLITLKLQSLF